jgi:hypothetical protein
MKNEKPLLWFSGQRLYFFSFLAFVFKNKGNDFVYIKSKVFVFKIDVA